MKLAFFFGIILALLMGLSGAASATSYVITVQTGTSSYSSSANITVTGQVSPAPGPSTSVFVRVFNPSMVVATETVAPVNGTTGIYTCSFYAGGSPAWIDGVYTVNSTWGAYGPVIFGTTTFSWSSSAVTSTTTTSTSSSQPSSSTSTSITSTTPTTSLTTSATSTTTSVSSTFTSTSTQTSSSPTSSTTSINTSTSTSGSVPEFPYQIIVAAVFSALIVGSYLLIRIRRGNTPAYAPIQ